MMPHHFPENIKCEIENSFLYPLEQPDIWKRLFSNSQYTNNLIKNIESIAKQGVINIAQLEACAVELTKPHQNYAFFVSAWSYFQPVICLDPHAPNWLDFSYPRKIEPDEKKATELIDRCHMHLPQEYNILNNQQWRECLGLCLLLYYPEPHQNFWQNPQAIVDWLRTSIQDPKQNSDRIRQEVFTKILFPHQEFDHAWGWLIENQTLGTKILEALQYYYLSHRLHQSLGSKMQFGFLQRVLDHQTGNVLYSIPHLNGSYLLRGNNTLIAGSANIKNTHVSEQFDLSFSTIHGAFNNPSINDHAAFCVASVFYEYIVDVFALPLLKDAKFKLEEQIENHFFMQMVTDHLQYFCPNFKVSEILPALERATEEERKRFLLASQTSISHDDQTTILNNIRAQGQSIATSKPEIMFRHCHLVTLEPEEILIQEGSPAAFAYVAFEEGLKGYSSRGKIEFHPKPWVMLGHIAIIQGGTRTATIKATKRLKLLMIHAEIYLYFWHITYSEQDFLKILS